MNRRVFLAIPLSSALATAQQKLDDPLLQAMAEELTRSLRLSIAGEVPYFIEYAVEEGQNYNAQATLGGLLISVSAPYRVPRVIVRVGSYEFDNSNAVFTGQIRSANYDRTRWPLESSRSQILQDLWLATDRAYKAAVQEFSLKKSALQNVTQSEKLNDFAKHESLVLLLPVAKATADEEKLNALARSLSALYSGYPKIVDSRIEVEESASNFFYANSEGTRVRVPETIASVRARMETLAADGAIVRNHRTFHAQLASQLPQEAVIRAECERSAKILTSIVEAPAGEPYTGPVLFDAYAAGQMMAQLIGWQLQPSRDPVSVPGRPVNMPSSDLEGRLGSRILPDSIDIVDDPAAQWEGRSLFGNYVVDFEGVAPARLQIVEKGVLKSLLYTRQPVRGHEGSVGRGRIPGAFGASTSIPSNLIVTSSQSETPEKMKKRLLEMVTQRRKPYGLIVRRLDFPSTAGLVELRRLAGAAQGSGSSRVFSLPLEIVRIYPDGREEYTRGLRFRSLNVRSLRDIVASGDDPAPFEYLANAAPLSLMGAGGYVVGSSVVCPSLLLEEAELEVPQQERPHLPLVPPPPAETTG